MTEAVEGKVYRGGQRSFVSGLSDMFPLSGRAVIEVHVRSRYGFRSFGAVVKLLPALGHHVHGDTRKYRLLIRLEYDRGTFGRVGRSGIGFHRDGGSRFAGTRDVVVSALGDLDIVRGRYDVGESIFTARVRSDVVRIAVVIYPDGRSRNGVAVLIGHLTSQYAVLRRIDVMSHIIIGFARGRGTGLEDGHRDIVPRIVTVRAESHVIGERRDIRHRLVFAGSIVQGADIAVQGTCFAHCDTSERHRHGRKQRR